LKQKRKKIRDKVKSKETLTEKEIAFLKVFPKKPWFKNPEDFFSYLDERREQIYRIMGKEKRSMTSEESRFLLALENIENKYYQLSEEGGFRFGGVVWDYYKKTESKITLLDEMNRSNPLVGKINSLQYLHSLVNEKNWHKKNLVEVVRFVKKHLPELKPFLKAELKRKGIKTDL